MFGKKTKFVVKVSGNEVLAARCVFRNKRWQIADCRVENFPETAKDEVVSAALGKIFKDLRLLNEHLLVILPRKYAVLRQINVPSVLPHEISAMIDFWAPRFLPYPAQDLVSGYSAINSYGGYTCVNMVVACKRDVERVLRLLGPAQARVESVILSSYVFCGLCFPAKKPALFIDLSGDCVEAAIVSEGKLFFSRGFNLPQDGYDVALAGEINKTLEAYSHENAAPKPEEILFIGENSGKVKDFIAGKFTLAVREIKSSAADALNVSHLYRETANLLPQDVKKKRGESFYARQLRLSVLLICAASVALMLLGVVGFCRKNDYLKRLKALNKDLSPRVEKLYRINRQLGAGETYPRVVDVLSGIYSSIPAGMRLVNLYYQQGMGLSIKGESDNLASVYDSLSLFGKNSIFKNPKVNYATKNLQGGVDFEVVIEMKVKTVK